jgi:hypothetical protein
MTQLEAPRFQRELLARDVFRLAFDLPHDNPESAAETGHALEYLTNLVRAHRCRGPQPSLLPVSSGAQADTAA